MEFLDGLITWFNKNAGFAGWLFGGFAAICTVVGACWKVRSNLREGTSQVLQVLIRCLFYVLGKCRGACSVGLNKLPKVRNRVSLYLLKRGVMDMKVNLNVLPNLSQTWADPYLRSDLAKASFLSASIVKYLHQGDENLRNAYIQQLVQTPIVRDVLVSNTLDGDLFWAQVAAYVVEVTKIYDQENFLSFPVPYSVVEDVVKNLFGEEAEEINGQDTA